MSSDQPSARKKPGAVVGAGRWLAKASLYSFVGDRKAFIEERKRNFGMIRQLGESLRSRPEERRRETFDEAMTRQGLTAPDIKAIDVSLGRQSRIYMLALAVIFAVFCMLPWVRSPWTHIVLCVSLGGYCGAILLRVRFRLAQVRAQELFPFMTWLRRFWGGAL